MVIGRPVILRICLIALFLILILFFYSYDLFVYPEAERILREGGSNFDSNKTAIAIATKLRDIQTSGLNLEKIVLLCWPNYIFFGDCSNCGQVSGVFNKMMNHLGFSSRIIGISGEDHQFNEFLFNGTWIQVDASANGQKYSFIYNDPGVYYRPIGVESGWGKNISQVFAIYENGSREDVTYRYVPQEESSNISIIVSKDSKPLKDADVRLISWFLVETKERNFSRLINSYKTDEKGTISVTLGKNNVTILVGYACLIDSICLYTNDTNVRLKGGQNFAETVALNELSPSSLLTLPEYVDLGILLGMVLIVLGILISLIVFIWKSIRPPQCSYK